MGSREHPAEKERKTQKEITCLLSTGYHGTYRCLLPSPIAVLFFKR